MPPAGTVTQTGRRSVVTTSRVDKKARRGGRTGGRASRGAPAEEATTRSADRTGTVSGSERRRQLGWSRVNVGGCTAEAADQHLTK